MHLVSDLSCLGNMTTLTLGSGKFEIGNHAVVGKLVVSALRMVWHLIRPTSAGLVSLP